MNNENNIEVFQCVCGKQFDNKKSLAKHKSTCKDYQKQQDTQKQQERESKRLPNGLFKCENPDCGKEHDGSYGSGRFCSEHCRRVYSGKRVNINGNQKCNFNTNVRSKPRRAPYGTWKCKYCGLIFETKNELQQHIWNNHQEKYGPHGKGQTSWNKSLTANTDYRIQKSINTLKNNYKFGKIIPSFKNKKHSIETREKISLFISKRNEQIQGGNGGRKDVKWFKVKNLNGIEYTVRGSWELNVAKRLNELGILWLKNKRISYIVDGITKQYNPDFYLPLTNEFIEVKGWFKDTDRIKMNYVLKQHNGIRIFFIDVSVYQSFISGGQLSDKMLYTYR